MVGKKLTEFDELMTIGNGDIIEVNKQISTQTGPNEFDVSYETGYSKVSTLKEEFKKMTAMEIFLSQRTIRGITQDSGRRTDDLCPDLLYAAAASSNVRKGDAFLAIVDIPYEDGKVCKKGEILVLEPRFHPVTGAFWGGSVAYVYKPKDGDIFEYIAYEAYVKEGIHSHYGHPLYIPSVDENPVGYVNGQPTDGKHPMIPMYLIPDGSHQIRYITRKYIQSTDGSIQDSYVLVPNNTLFWDGDWGVHFIPKTNSPNIAIAPAEAVRNIVSFSTMVNHHVLVLKNEWPTMIESRTLYPLGNGGHVYRGGSGLAYPSFTVINNSRANISGPIQDFLVKDIPAGVISTGAYYDGDITDVTARELLSQVFGTPASQDSFNSGRISIPDRCGITYTYSYIPGTLSHSRWVAIPYTPFGLTKSFATSFSAQNTQFGVYPMPMMIPRASHMSLDITCDKVPSNPGVPYDAAIPPEFRFSSYGNAYYEIQINYATNDNDNSIPPAVAPMNPRVYAFKNITPYDIEIRIKNVTINANNRFQDTFIFTVPTATTKRVMIHGNDLLVTLV